MLDLISREVARAVVQLTTGRLLSQKQIEAISSSLAGKLFSDLLPQPDERRRAQSRIEQAQRHIADASQIVADLKLELDEQVAQLQALAADIELKRAKAEEYSVLLKADEPTVRAMRTQMEEAVRHELEQQFFRGRRLRQVLATIGWLVTLAIGSAVGSHWPEIEDAARRLF
jgi:chromosome segregation ATPase